MLPRRGEILRASDLVTFEASALPGTRQRRLAARSVLHRVSPDGWAIAAVALAVVLANLPYLLGYFDPNPLGTRSGLAFSISQGLINGKPTIDPNIGYSSQAIGHLAALDILHLHLPWWNPYEATGMPLLGETQSAALFPPTLLTALSGGQVYERMLLELVAGISTYLLLRRIAITRPAACAGAIAFALDGTFAWFAHAAINPVPFLPMLVLGIERAYTAACTGRRGGWRLIVLAGGLSIYAGFPEVAYIDALMALCWLGWRAGCLKADQRRALAAKAALGGLGAALVSAPMLMAMSGFLGHADVGVHTTARLGAEHLPGSAMPQLLMPYVYGQINSDPRAVIWTMVGGYVSTSLLLLAAVGVCARAHRGLRLVVLGWGLLVFARMYGQPPLLGHVIGVLPEMSKVEVFRYGTPVLELSVIVLAALGLDDAVRVPQHRRRLLWGALGIAGLVGAAALAARPVVRGFGTGFHHGPYLVASVVWAALVVVATAGAALLRDARRRAILLALVVAGDALALFVVPEFSAPRADRVDLAPVVYLQRHLGTSRFFTLGPIAPNYGSYFGLATLNINDFPPTAYAGYVHARLDPVVDPGLFVGNFGGWRPRRAPTPESELMRHLDGYRAAAVRYVLTPAGQSLPQGKRTFRLVRRTPTTWIYELAGTSGYFTAGGCEIQSSGREAAQLSCRGPATLVRRETWFDGWTARVDGHLTPIRRVDGLFQAVSVPAGSHRIEFSFAPPGIGWGWLALIGGCALMCVPWIAARTGRPRSRGVRRSARPAAG
ncbi:MAG TPA: YfhO family protein [Solirubrobacteraceae bacterium]|nr:YfhO family protein [Solirubrobacteraceae bacterium]